MIRDILRPDYRAHAVLVEPARTKSELWRLVAGIVLTIALFLVAVQMFAAAFISLFVADGLEDQFFADLDHGTSIATVYFILLQISLLIPAVALAASALHGRTLRSLVGPSGLAVNQFVSVLFIQVALGAIVFALPPYGYENGELDTNIGFGLWIMLFPLSVVVVLLQCAAEEIVFRGYIQQQLAARFRSPLIWLVIPSFVFGALHFMPDTAGENALMIAVWAGVFGALMADLTARAGTLGPAIAIHLVNNALAVMLFAPADDLFGIALYKLPFGLSDEDAVRAWLMVDFLYMLTSWLAARLVLRR